MEASQALQEILLVLEEHGLIARTARIDVSCQRACIDLKPLRFTESGEAIETDSSHERIVVKGSALREAFPNSAVPRSFDR